MYMQLSEEEKKLIENYRASNEVNRKHLQLLASITAREKTRSEKK